MSIDTSRFTTADGKPYRVVSETLAGSHPIAIESDGEIHRLTPNLVCTANEGYSLTERRNACTRFFNVYRAADGGFCMGSRAFASNEDRRATQDSQRAIFALKVEFDENNGNVSASRA